jgi:hypothetical protein
MIARRKEEIGMKRRAFFGWAAAGAVVAGMIATGASAPYYMPIQEGAYSEYASVSTLQLPFGVEVTKRATMRLSIDRVETDGEESNVWVKIEGKAGEETGAVEVRVKASALASLPAVSDDLEPFVNVLESVSGAKVWVNDELVKKQKGAKAPELRGALGMLGAFLDLSVKPVGKARVDTPAGKMACEWYEMTGKAASPEGVKAGGAKLEFTGKFCLSRDVPFRWVRSVYDFEVVMRPPKRKMITITGHHEGTLIDYGPRESVKGTPARPPALLP